MYVLCIIVLSLKMVKEAVVNTYREGRLDSIEKVLKRTNRILKCSNRKFERIVIGALWNPKVRK